MSGIRRSNYKKGFNQPRGFSLLEVLISGVLLAIIGMTLVVTLNSSLDVKDKVESISNRYHLVRQAMARMTREISMAYLSGHKNPSYAVIDTQFKGDRSSLSFVAFGGFVKTKDARQSDQREITYFIDQDRKTNKSSLMRKEKINPTRKLGEEGKVQVLSPDIVSVEFKYWNDKTQNWDSDWKTEGAAAQFILPSRVSIELVAMLENEVEQKFVTETEIWATQPILIK